MSKGVLAGQQEPKYIKKKVRQFCNDTSFLPVSQAYKSGNVYMCASIVIMSVLMSGFMVYQITTLVMKYYQYPIQVDFELSSANQQEFPSVTICNLNPMRMEAIRHTEIFALLETLRDDGRRDILYQYAENKYNDHYSTVAPSSNESSTNYSTTLPIGTTPSTTANITNMTTVISNSKTTTPPKIRRKRGDSWSEFLTNQSYNQWTSGLDSVGGRFYKEIDGESKAFSDVIDKIDPHKLARYSQTLNEFLLKCRFKGYSCSPKNFTVVDNYKYGRCWTFNPSQMNGVLLPPLINQNTGPMHGLVLELFINQDSYVPSLSPQAGGRVLVHTRGEMPFPEDAGFTISPGKSTSVGLRKTHIIRLPVPHGKCVDTSTETLYSKRYNLSYSKSSCEKSCLQERIILECACAFAKYIVPKDPKPKICRTTKALKCARDLEKKFRANELDCDIKCPLTCEVLRYETIMSSSSWPSEKYKPDIVKRLSRVSSKFTDIHNRIEQDVAKLEVYYNELDYLVIEQKEAYGFEDLVSDLGGQLGLYMGISLLAIAEVIGLLMTMCQEGVKRVYTSYRPHIVSPNEIKIAPDAANPPFYESPQNSVKK